MTERYVADSLVDTFWPGDVVVLGDRESKSWARIVPALGCNLVGFGAEIGGNDVETFLQPSDESPTQPPSHYGAPVLYPYPNRLRNGQARFAGRTILIDRAPGQVHAIHGLVRNRPWTIDRLGGGQDAATLCCSIEADQDVLRQFPFPYRLSLSFQLTGRALRIDVDAENLGDAPMPMGFGWHPYFRLPLVPGTDRTATIVQIPARQTWKLDETLVPTGEIAALTVDRDFRSPRALGSTYLDDVYTDLERVDGASGCTFWTPGGIGLRASAGPTFREWVVYAPPTRPTICFEPYTCPTDAFNLADRGIDAGVIVLEPGGRWTDWMQLELVTRS